MREATRWHRRWARFLPWTVCCLMASVTGIASVSACAEEDQVAGPNPPGEFTITAESVRDSVKVMWDKREDADSFKVAISSNPTYTKWYYAEDTMAVFTSGDGVEDDTDYTSTVTAFNQGGETVSSNSPTVTTNFFPWDEYYTTSLHYTRAGKAFFYNTTPNDGYETLTGIPYGNLPCQGCHRPDQAVGTNGCESCHDTAAPELGAQVDASLDGVCGGCHSRQVAERSTPANYTDAHDAVSGGDCMYCHTLEDMHGDGTEYNSMLEDGAIDAKCSDCHTDVSGVATAYHPTHISSVDCSTCHMQGVVSCANCHFEGQVSVPETKMARTRIVDWMLLVNRNGKVHPANVQTLEYQGETFAAIAPFYSHTIARNAVSGCTDCHGNANITALTSGDSTLVVMEASDAVPDFGTKGTGLVGPGGRVPVPFYYSGKLLFDFVHYDTGTGTWSFVERGPDGYQMLFAEPLTEAQINALK
jgi:predicted CXXCH cytochrome family protein